MSHLRAYLLPGLVFQSVVIAGGYGSGREIVEFFLTIGPRAGLVAMVVATAVWSIVCALSFEYARITGSRDYRTFFRHLLGPAGSVIYELAYLGFMAIVLAVIAALAGSLLRDTFGVPYLLGVILMISVIAVLVFWGTESIQRVLSVWSLVLYAVFAVLFVWAFRAFGGQIREAFSSTPVTSGSALLQGLKYAGYNLAVIPALLFSLEAVRTRKHAIVSGLLAGPIAMVPAFLFYVAMVGLYPDIVPEEVPANFVLEAIGSRWFLMLFQVMLFGTLIETGTGMIHGVNERLSTWHRERGREMPAGQRTGVALAFLVAAAVIAQFGLISLIAEGYGTLTWVFILLYVVPVTTLGLRRIMMYGGRDG